MAARTRRGSGSTQEVGAELRQQEQEYREIAAAQAASGPSDDVADLSQFPEHLHGRDDDALGHGGPPPDILVTNYSMLNTIMMRSFEAPIFEQPPAGSAMTYPTSSRWSWTDSTSTAALRAVRSP